MVATCYTVCIQLLYLTAFYIYNIRDYTYAQGHGKSATVEKEIREKDSIGWFFNYRQRIYSVMQSDGNIFGGDVVLDSLNKASQNEDNIFDQIYITSKYVRNIITMILILYNIIRKCILT